MRYARMMYALKSFKYISAFSPSQYIRIARTSEAYLAGVFCLYVGIVGLLRDGF
jgi:hypothetical protein